jgi:hypothetical protein
MVTAFVLGTMLAMGPPIRVGAGVTCTPWSPRGAPRNTLPTPVSYRVSDLGKPGVPVLDEKSRAVLRRIARAHRSRTLRFAYLFAPGKAAGTRQRFIVFDATEGPCAEGARYRVLNAAVYEYYQPSESPWGVAAMPGA